jgi:hypothetical protein
MIEPRATRELQLIMEARRHDGLRAVVEGQKHRRAASPIQREPLSLSLTPGGSPSRAQVQSVVGIRPSVEVVARPACRKSVTTELSGPTSEEQPYLRHNFS